MFTTGCSLGHVSACKVFDPIYLDKKDRLTEGTARQILTHDLKGADLCDWQPVTQGVTK